jgi:hypothetical protein
MLEGLSPAKFREMFLTLLEDAETRGAIIRSLAACLPHEGGSCSSITSSGGTGNYLPKFTGTCNIENSNVYQLGSKIGIGTTLPAYMLDVVGGSARVTNPSGTTQLTVSGSATSGRLGQDAAGFFFSSDTNGAALRFATSNGTLNEWMRITSDGNIGIATTSPQAQLAVASGSVVIGGTATKQDPTSHGPEKLSVQDTDALKVAVAAFVGSETNARLLIDMNGNHEWSNDGTDQTVVLGCTAIGRMNLVGFPMGSPAGGGLGIVAWKSSYLTSMVDSTTMTFPMHDTSPFAVNGRLRVENEICTINSIGVGTLNVNRHQEGTMAVSHSINAPVVAIGTEEAQPRILFLNDGGGIAFSDGINVTDVSISRPVANQILINGNLATGRANVTLVNMDNADIGLLGATFVKVIGPSAAFAVTGFAGGSEGRILLLYNSTSNTMTIKNKTGSLAGNQILTLTGADVSLRAGGQSFATFIYDASQTLWILAATN